MGVKETEESSGGNKRLLGRDSLGPLTAKRRRPSETEKRLLTCSFTSGFFRHAGFKQGRGGVQQGWFC